MMDGIKVLPDIVGWIKERTIEDFLPLLVGIYGTILLFSVLVPAVIHSEWIIVSLPLALWGAYIMKNMVDYVIFGG